MKRGISLILAILVFSMSLAYSLDSFVELPDTHIEFTDVNDLEQHHQGESIDCDHCCHGTSHLTGIPSQSIRFSKSHAEQYHIFYNEQLAVLSQTPPTPPPTA